MNHQMTDKADDYARRNGHCKMLDIMCSFRNRRCISRGEENKIE